MTFKQEETDPGVITDIMGQEPLKKVESEEKSEEVVQNKTTEPVVEAQEKKTEEEEKLEEKENEEEEKVDWEAKAKKLEQERDNYKKALLIAKGKTLSLGGIKKTEEDKSKWDETSDEFQKETLTKVQQQVHELLEKRNEQGAIKRFLKKHPSVATRGWNDVVEFYKASRGRETVDDILEDLEDAYLVSKRNNGTLKEDLEKAKLEGERKGIVKTKTAQMASVSGAGNHSVTKTESKKGVSDKAKEMAMRMKTPLDKLEQEDDSVTTTLNSI